MRGGIAGSGILGRTERSLAFPTAASVRAPPSWVRLGLRVQPQAQKKWCWAAVATSVSVFRDRTSDWTQCRVASAVLDQTTCCTAGDTEACNRAAQLDAALRRTGNLRAPAQDGPLEFPDVKTEIDNDFPIGAHIEFGDGGSHFVLLCGYLDDATQSVSIQDPEIGQTDLPLTQFLTRYRTSGSWDLTYFTK
jgi:hypothetical protein